MRGIALALVVVALLGGTAHAVDPGVDDAVKLNQIQVVGSHNSYHLRATQAEYEVRQAIAPAFNIGLDYEHPALGVQFASQGIRRRCRCCAGRHVPSRRHRPTDPAR